MSRSSDATEGITGGITSGVTSQGFKLDSKRTKGPVQPTMDWHEQREVVTNNLITCHELAGLVNGGRAVDIVYQDFRVY